MANKHLYIYEAGHKQAIQPKKNGITNKKWGEMSILVRNKIKTIIKY